MTMTMTDLHADFVGNPEVMRIVTQFVEIDPELRDALAECATRITRTYLSESITTEDLAMFERAWATLESYGDKLARSGFPDHASALLQSIKIFGKKDMMKHLDIARKMMMHTMLRMDTIDGLISDIEHIRSTTAVAQILPQKHFGGVGDERARALAKDFASDPAPSPTKALELVKQCVVESADVTKLNMELRWTLMEEVASKFQELGQLKHSHCVLTALSLFIDDGTHWDKQMMTFITMRSRGIIQRINSLQKIIAEQGVADSAKKRRKR